MFYTVVEKEGPVTVCGSCLSEYGKGKQHNCDRASRRENLGKLIRQTSERSRSRVVSSQLKEIASERKVEEGENVLLSTGGLPLPVKIGSFKNVKPPPFFDHLKILKLKSSLGLSDNKTKQAAHFLRVEVGKKAVEKGLEENLKHMNHRLDDQFTLDKVVYKEKNNQKKDKNNNDENI